MTVRTHSDDTIPAELLDGMLTADAPFGDSSYILSRMRDSFVRKLSGLGDDVPAAGALADALETAPAVARERTLQDPVVRAAILHARRQQRHPGAPGLTAGECAGVFTETVEHLERGGRGGPLAEAARPLDRLGPGPHHGAVWSDDGSDSAVVRAYRSLVRSSFGGTLASATGHDVAALRRGVELLDDVAPAVTASALGHTYLTALFPSSGAWHSMASGSRHQMVGGIYLRREMISDPWWVAEHLLHEALHQKYYDLRHGHSVLVRDATGAEDGPHRAIVSIWNLADRAGSNRWAASRGMAAFHVYAHLALLGRLAEQRLPELQERYGRRDTGPTGLTGTRSATDRARYLGDALRTHCWDDLGDAGRCLVDWLTQFLAALDGPAREPMVRARLTLERYVREARLIERGEPGCDGTVVAELARDETAATGAVLDALAPGTYPPVDAAAVTTASGFALARRALAGTLVAALHGSADDDAVPAADRVVEMVDRSSGRLDELVVPTPAPAPTPAPIATERPAVEVRAARAALPDLTDVLGEGYGTAGFCLFLHGLVRMWRPRTIVELGTGYGASALWMALAAEQNGTGHVWTVDDRSRMGPLREQLERHREQWAGTVWHGLAGTDPTHVPVEAARILGVDGRLTFVTATMRLEEPEHFAGYGFAEPVDLLFSDFSHGPDAVLRILGHFLPRMAEDGSILLDSASTSWPTYLMLERLVEHLAAGRVPRVLQECCPVDLAPLMADRTVRLTHLTRAGTPRQNSAAWLTIQPLDMRPYPRAPMRGTPTP